MFEVFLTRYLWLYFEVSSISKNLLLEMKSEKSKSTVKSSKSRSDTAVRQKRIFVVNVGMKTKKVILFLSKKKKKRKSYVYLIAF